MMVRYLAVTLGVLLGKIGDMSEWSFPARSNSGSTTMVCARAGLCGGVKLKMQYAPAKSTFGDPSRSTRPSYNMWNRKTVSNSSERISNTFFFSVFF